MFIFSLDIDVRERRNVVYVLTIFLKDFLNDFKKRFSHFFIGNNNNNINNKKNNNKQFKTICRGDEAVGLTRHSKDLQRGYWKEIKDRRNSQSSQGMSLPDENIIQALREGEGYKYLGVLEANGVLDDEIEDQQKIPLAGKEDYTVQPERWKSN